MNDIKNDFNGVVEELEELDQIAHKQRRVLAQLLDIELAKKDQFIALKGEMGVVSTGNGTSKLVPSYVSSHTLDWIGTFVKMGSDMPFMQSKIDDAGRLIVDESNAEELKQRAPDWTRQPALTAYLVHDKNRKFGTILAVISPPWVDDPNHENWGSDGRALKSAVTYRALDSAGKTGVLDLNDVHIYALDGQHRVMGIRGVKNLQDGKLQLKKKDGTSAGTIYLREDFLKEFHSNITHLQSVLNERISIEYIPAVLPGETRRKASQRVRSVFVAINSYAKKTVKGEEILLDESDGFAITARAVGVHHPLLKDSEGSRVNWKNTSLPKRSRWYTTLQALKDMAVNYLSESEPELTQEWKPKFKGQVPIRPQESDLEYAREKFSELWDYIQKMPVFQGLESGDALEFIREFPPDGKGHLLVRPIGQTIVAKVVGQLVRKGMTLKDIFEKLNKLDLGEIFETSHKENIFYGVTYNPKKNSINAATTNQEFAAKLLGYMILGADEQTLNELKESLAKYRSMEDGRMPDFQGVYVEAKAENLTLPNPID